MKNNQSSKLYLCERVSDVDSSWSRLSSVNLSDVATGGAVQEETVVKACWNNEALYVRFECVDTHSVSSFVNYNDALYEQDVVEVFIDVEGTGRNYVEIEVSPNNVVFDAKVTNDIDSPTRQIKVDLQWDESRLETKVESEGDSRVYTIKVPFTTLDKQPGAGEEWRINFYRIDEDKAGNRHFQAWSPTGIIDYHIPEHFGQLRFVASTVE